ncbi:putative Ig domain-containing protein [Leptolyngbya sp. PL-A3]|uniref:putative Ig domain-containing protein n=1 Tax=Leptolyngbya sp. PL-A3 TaxID=2933911 RepID=UPI003297CDF5
MSSANAALDANASRVLGLPSALPSLEGGCLKPSILSLWDPGLPVQLVDIDPATSFAGRFNETISVGSTDGNDSLTRGGTQSRYGFTTFDAFQPQPIIYRPQPFIWGDRQGSRQDRNNTDRNPSPRQRQCELSISNVQVQEGQNATARFTITLSRPSRSPIRVCFRTVAGAAKPGEDYIARRGTLTFNPGETRKTLNIRLLDDQVVEGNETFFVELTRPTRASVRKRRGRATICDNDVNRLPIVDPDKTLEILEDSQPVALGIQRPTDPDGPVRSIVVTEIPLSNIGNVQTATGNAVAVGQNLTPDELAALRFTPAQNANGNAGRFSYVVTDGQGTTARQHISLVVTPVNDAPTMTVPPSQSVQQNTAIALPGLAINDIDASNAELEVALTASNGTLTLNPIAGITFLEGSGIGEKTLRLRGNLTALNSTLATLTYRGDTNFVGQDAVALRVNDLGNTGAGGAAEASGAIAITVTTSQGTNASPVADGDKTLFVSSTSTSIALGITAPTDSDGDALTLTVMGIPSASQGSIQLADGAVVAIGQTLTPAQLEGLIFVPNAGATGNAGNFIYRVEDGRGGSDSQTVSFVITPAIRLTEGASFRVSAEQAIQIPATPSVLRFTYTNLFFDTTDPDFINDAFEVAVVGADGRSLVPTIGNGQDAFFNLTEGINPELATGVSVDGTTVSVNLAGIEPGIAANLIFRLINNDSDIRTAVEITQLELLSVDGITPPTLIPVSPGSTPQPSITFARLTDVSSSIGAIYNQTSFNQVTGVLTTELGLQNSGTYSVRSPLLVAIDNLSDPTVEVLNADGITPNGLPYYDFSRLITGSFLDPTQQTGTRVIAFRNPNSIQFTYDLVVLSELNGAPSIESSPVLSVIGGQTYAYNVAATDPDGDALTYNLLVAPDGMTLNAQGQLRWSTALSDIANHTITIQANDGHGGIAEQSFTLAVIAEPPNRPPVLTTNPVVDAQINQPYVYDADAVDLDQDQLQYSLVSGPSGMTVDPSTGLVRWTPPPILSLGETVIGQLRLPGDTDEFTFSGVSGQRLYLDALQGFNGLQINIYAPSGRQISPVDGLFTLTQTGNYRIVADGAGATTGRYGFSLIDTALIPEIPFDTLIQGRLGPASEDDVFRFRGHAGQKLYFDQLSNSTNIRWVLYGTGNQLITQSSFRDDIELSLPHDGEYLLVLKGEGSFDTATDYAFRIVTPDEITQPFTLGSNDIPNAVSGSIGEPGEQDFYTFVGTRGQRIYLDRLSLVDNSSLVLTLENPNGGTIITRRFDGGGEWGPITLTEDGTYRIRIDGTFDNLGNYSFSLRDLSLATPINPDQPYSGALNPGESSHLYQFNVVAGQRVFIEFQDTSLFTGRDSVRWGLYDSGNREVAVAFTGRYIEVLANRADTYTLIIEGDQEEIPVNYSFQVITPETVVTPLVFNSLVSGQIGEKGEQDVFTFTGNQGQRVALEILNSTLTSAFGNRVTLLSPSGHAILNDIAMFSNGQAIAFNNRFDPLILPENGTYQLRVDGVEGATEAYSFRLVDLNSAPILLPGVVTSGAVNPGNGYQFYQFTGSRGDRLSLDINTTFQNLFHSLYGPGNQLIGGTSRNNEPLDSEYVLPGDGTYYLMVRGESTAPISYDVQIALTPSSLGIVPSLREIQFGETIQGSITGAGQRHVYTFNGQHNERLIFDNLNSLGLGNGLSIAVYSPSGQLLLNHELRNNDPNTFTLNETGTYRIEVLGSVGNPSPYRFRLLNFADATTVSFNTPLTGNVGTTTQETHLYRFAGEAGQRIYFDRQIGASGNSYTLYSPAGQPLFSQSLTTDYELTALPTNGEYVLAVTGGDTSDGNYRFNLASSENANNGYTLGSVVQSGIGAAGETDYYRFTGQPGQLLWLDFLSVTDSNLTVQLETPSGQRLGWPNFPLFLPSYNSSGGVGLPILQEAGTYTLIFDGQGDATGEYGFRLLDLASAPQLSLDTQFSGVFGPSGREALTYRFTANAGERLYFDTTFNGPFGSDYTYSLYDSLGSPIVSSNVLVWDLELSSPLQRNGEYYLVISGNGSVPREFSFEISTPEFTTSNYTLGTSVFDAITEAGEQDWFTFEGQVGQQFYLDTLLASNFSPLTTIYAPSGQSYTFNLNANSDQRELFTLQEAGTYRFRIDAPWDGTGQYGFRLLDVAQAATLNFNSTITGNFGATSRESRLYRFTAAASDSIFLDVLNADGTNTFSLYELSNGGYRTPSGMLSAMWDKELSFSRAGEYLLVLGGEGSPNNQYSVNVVKPTALPENLTFGSTISGEIRQPGQRNTYLFNGSVGQQLFLDTLAGVSGLEMQLVSPSGQLMTRQPITSPQGTLDWAPFTLAETGSYKLVVNGTINSPSGSDSFTTGSYSFVLYDLNQSSQLSVGTTTSGNLAPGNSVDLYQFTGRQGTTLRFDLLDNQWNGANWTLYDPGARAIATPQWFSPDFGITLASDGRYTLVVQGSRSTPINYTFQVTDTSVTSIQNTGFNVVESGAIANAGQVNRYTFTANAGTRVFFDSQDTSSSSLRFRLINPDGTIAINNGQLTSDGTPDNFQLGQTGAYQFEVYGLGGTSTGNYQYQLLELSSEIPSASHPTIQIGDYVRDALPNGRAAEVFSFEGELGERIFLNGIQGSGIAARLYAPNGREIFFLGNMGSQDSGPYTLTQAGTYHLVIQGEQNTPTNYEFQLLSLDDGQPLTFTLPNRGTLTSGLQQVSYSFQGEAGQRLFFDSRTASGNQWMLYGPDNQLVQAPTSLWNDFELELQRSGTYTLILGGSEVNPLNYDFTVYSHDAEQIRDVIIPGSGEASSTESSLGSFAVQLRVDDGQGGVAFQNYQIQLLPDASNSAPIITSTPEVTVGLNQGVYSYRIESFDPNNDVLSYRLVEAPTNAYIDRETGHLVWVPGTLTVGERYTFTVEVNDRRGGSDRQTFTVEAQDNNVRKGFGEIKGSVWIDGNSDGQRGATEGGLAGVPVYLDLNANGQLDPGEPVDVTAIDNPTTLTVDETGQYHFRDLAPGTYVVRQVNPAGFVQTSPNRPLRMGNDGVLVGGNLSLLQPNPTDPATFTGRAGISTDGVGMNSSMDGYNGTGTVQAEVPAGSTIEYAFLHVATRASSQTVGFRPEGITFEGTPVSLTWLDNVQDAGRLNFETGRADVTSLVASRIGREGGIFNFTVDEVAALESALAAVEGISLTVIYSNPLLPERTIIVLEGGLTGEAPQTNVVLLDEPLNTTSPDFAAEMALGIQYGWQPYNLNPSQASIIDVNRTRLTSVAGGTNDGISALIGNTAFGAFLPVNGALFTIGGVGDSPNNPTNPLSTVNADDDELYTLTPFIRNGDTAIQIDTSNPSSDDLIFLTTLTLPSGARLDTSGFHSVNVAPSEVVENVNFGNARTAASIGNTAPTFVSQPPTTITAGERLRYQAVATDSAPANDQLFYDLVVKPEGMTVDQSTGAVFWNPTADQIGTANVVLRVTDSYGERALQYFQLEVRPPNAAPVFSSSPSTSTTPQVGKAFQYNVVAVDPDGDTVNYTLAAESPAGLVVDSVTGVLTWTPTMNQLGNQTVNVIAQDGRGGEATQAITLSVIQPQANTAPQITSEPRVATRTNTPYVYQVAVSEPDGDRLTFSLSDAPNGMTIDPQMGRLSWQPGASQVGAHTVSVVVQDGQGGRDTQTYRLNVTHQAANFAPEITSEPFALTSVGRTYQYQASGVDPDGDAIFWELVGAPTGMTINAQTGAVGWQPSLNQVGNHTVTLQATDIFGAGTRQTFTLTVRSTNTPPLILSTPPTQVGITQAYRYQVQATDPEGDALQFSLSNRPNGMTINGATGEIVWTPQANQLGTHTIEVLARDAQGGTSRQSYTLVVSPNAVNQAPTITTTPQFWGDVASGYRYQLAAIDPDGDALRYSLLSGPAGLSVNAATGLVRWNPTTAQVGEHRITLAVFDSQGLGATQSYTIEITAANQAPVIRSTPMVNAIANTDYRYDVWASDPDDEPITITLQQAPAGMTIDEQGRISWSANNVTLGTHAITVAVTDSHGAVTTQTYNLVVQNDAIAPQVNLTVSRPQVNVGDSVVLRALATDNVGVEFLTLTVGGQAVALDPSGRATVQLTALGDITAVATAIDAAGNTSTSVQTIRVIDPTDSDFPVVDLTSLENGQPFTTVITNLTDVIGTVTDDNLQFYTLSIAPAAGGEFREIYRGTSVVNGGFLGTFDPTTLQNDSYILRLSATDTGGRTAYDETLVDVGGDLKLGNFRLSFNDLSIPVSGIPIQVTRTYDSLTSNDRDNFGYGWRMEFRDTDLRTSLGTDPELIEFGISSKGLRAGDRVYITLPGGQRQGFTFQPRLAHISRYFLVQSALIYEPEFVADNGVTSTLRVRNTQLVRTQTGEFAGLNGALYNPANETYGFGGYYDLTTREGIAYRIDALTGDLETITDRNNNTLTFTDRDITSSTGQRVTFERDVQGRITAVIDPEGNRITYQYDQLGDLVSVSDREGNVTRYDYNDTRAHYLQEIIDPLGRSGVRTEYDDQGRLRRMVDATGNPVELIYNPNNNIQQVRDQLGNVTTYEYDERGNVLTEINALGGTIRRTYDDDNNTLTETDALGNVTQFTYDSSGNRLTETDPLGNVTRYTYDANGNVLTTTDPTGQTTTNTYDSRGNLTQISGQASGPINLSYDASGNMTAMQDGSGTTTFEYDRLGNVLRQVDALGNVTTYTYDGNGNRTTETRTQTLADGTVRNLVTRMEYDNAGRMIRVTNPEGDVTQTIYDAVGNRIEKVDALGRSTRYVYDEQGQLVETIYPDGTPNNVADNPRTRTEYDAAGRVVAEIDELGRRTVMVYDQLGRQIAAIYPDATPNDETDNPRTRTEYDAAGRTIAQIDERGNRTQFLYDAVGRRIATILPDETPNDDTDNPRVLTTYDTAGRQLTQADPLGQVTRSLYDNVGRPIGQEYADGTRTSTQFDAAGRVVARTDQAGITTRYEYDPLGRLAAVIDVRGQRTEYTHDSQGNLIVQRDANGNETRYEYDGLGRRVATVLPMGQRSTSAYDAVGNLIRTTDFNGDTINYTYNERNWRTSSDLPGTEFDRTYTYTADGQRRTVVDARGTTTYTYDGRNRLIRRSDPDGRTIAYTYDAAGNRTSIEIPSGTTAYTFDAQNRLSTVTDPQGGVTRYTYNAVGALTRTEFPNGTVETRAYDNLNRLVYIETSGPQDVIVSFRYTLDATGNRTSVIEHNGRRVDYSYDSLYRLTRETIYNPGATAPSRTIEYVYDNVGNRLSRTDTGEGTTIYTYDNNDRLLTSTINSVETTYTYDNNGNTTSRTTDGTTITYTWNADNRLIGADTDGNGSIDVTNRYNQNGIRVSQTVNGEETRFLIDENQDYAQVLEEYTPGEIIKVSYVYGNDLVSQDREGEQFFYHVDSLGSTRALSDEAGLDAAQYIYDAFGQLITPIGTIKNPYLFAGEQRDTVLDLDYLRQRYLNFANGRLNSRDDFDGLIQKPITLNKYIYGNSNPVTFIDPSGNFSIFSIGASLALNTVLHGILLGDILLSRSKAIVKNNSNTSPRFLPSAPATEVDLIREVNGTKSAPGPSSPHGWRREGVGHLSYFHPGAFSAYRRLSANGVSGQQVTYDFDGKLITGGAGAGTPDLISSEYSVVNHFLADVLPFWRLGWQEYTSRPEWAPQNERNAPRNVV